MLVRSTNPMRVEAVRRFASPCARKQDAALG